MTVVSSSSSDPTSAPAKPIQAPAIGAPTTAANDEPLIELREVGIWYQLHRRKLSLKQALLRWRFHEKPRVHWALRGLSAEFHHGQTVGVVGHNGAGKSTLCSVLARILDPDEGTAIIRGHATPLFGLGTGFNSKQSGRANIYLYAAYLGIPRAEIKRKMADIIAFSELGEFIDEPIFTYSTGMRGRLGFSVAAILEPKILILDEVLSAGDRAFRAKSRARMMEMMAQSSLIVIVSHSSAFLRKICTHCLWLDHGRQKMFGEARKVLNAYDLALGGRDADAADDPDEE